MDIQCQDEWEQEVSLKKKTILLKTLTYDYSLGKW